MPWNRKETDPLESRRRQLAQAERNLQERRRQISEKLHCAPPGAKPMEPPVWRMEDDARPRRTSEPSPARKRHLARQRQRDRALFFIFIVVLLIVLVAVYWIASAHSAGQLPGT